MKRLMMWKWTVVFFTFLLPSLMCIACTQAPIRRLPVVDEMPAKPAGTDTIVNPPRAVVALSAGGMHTCALLRDQSVRCWGSNHMGQLGNESVREISTIPVPVMGIFDIKAISAGYGITCVIVSDGKVKCFGFDLTRSASDIKTIDIKDMPKLFSRPVEVKDISNAVAVAAGWEHVCVVLSNGRVKCWGGNSEGQLGDGTVNIQTTPVEVKGISDAVAITTGIAHTCAVLSNGTVKCWGTDSFGGKGKIYGFNSLTPVEIMGISDAMSVAAGRNHTCALLSEGTVKCWGSNVLGQLGSTRAFISAAPLKVSGISNAVGISAGLFHTCTLHSDGTVKCWGYKYKESEGVSPTPFTIEISNAIAITSGGSHSCAYLSDNTVKCWGGNEVGQLGGDIRTKYSSDPVTVVESETKEIK